MLCKYFLVDHWIVFCVWIIFKVYIFPGGYEVTVDLQTGWKPDPDAETAAILPVPQQPPAAFPGGHHHPSFSLVTSVSPASEMISMEMPVMGHIGQHHPPPHHQPQMSPNYDGSDKKKNRECRFHLVLMHGLLLNTLKAHYVHNRFCKYVHLR